MDFLGILPPTKYYVCALNNVLASMEAFVDNAIIGADVNRFFCNQSQLLSAFNGFIAFFLQKIT
jgi:hypothetical protein